MDGRSLNQRMEEELNRIPAGTAGSAQQKLRMIYNAARRHRLTLDPEQAPAEALAYAVAVVRAYHPEFEPALTDPDYFEWRSRV